MGRSPNEWFETGEIAGRRSYYSKFSKQNFTFSLKSIQEEWPEWTSDERRRFCSAFGFSGKTELSNEERLLLDFLMQNGNPEIWRAIALMVARHPNRDLALKFLLSRVTEETEHLANYYQALAILSTPDCVPVLKKKLLSHRHQVDSHTSPESWGESFLYSDYLYCSATLFQITGQEEYKNNLRKILEHPQEKVRQKIRTIAASNGFGL